MKLEWRTSASAVAWAVLVVSKLVSAMMDSYGIKREACCFELLVLSSNITIHSTGIKKDDDDADG